MNIDVDPSLKYADFKSFGYSPRSGIAVGIGEDVGKMYTHKLLVGLQISAATLERIMEILQKALNGTTI